MLTRWDAGQPAQHPAQPGQTDPVIAGFDPLTRSRHLAQRATLQQQIARQRADAAAECVRRWARGGAA